MEKKLPGIFANKIDKKLNNNSSYFVSKKENMIDENKTNESNINVNQKIRNIFNSMRYVYKADVEIVLKDKKIIKRIIGKNDGSLITIDNELIPLSEIKDIYFVD